MAEGAFNWLSQLQAMAGAMLRPCGLCSCMEQDDQGSPLEWGSRDPRELFDPQIGWCEAAQPAHWCAHSPCTSLFSLAAPSQMRAG